MQQVFVVGTGDTKEEELRYLVDRLGAAGVPSCFVDVGTSGHRSGADIRPGDVAAYHPDGASAVRSSDRGEAVAAMSIALERYVADHADECLGVIGAGGSGGTALVTPAMRGLPIGVPKLMVSTVASGDVAGYVGPADILMLHSVADVAGLNRISRRVLGNAAHAMAGMVRHRLPDLPDDRPVVALSMFGVTTPLVTGLADALSARFEPLIFHATGTGGRAMEKLVDDGLVTAVLDMTTTEIVDHLVGGVLSAGPGRLDAIARSGVPYVGSVGACDMVNFGPMDSVPVRFRGRTLHAHNTQVTLMRTTPEECRQAGEFIARKLEACEGPVRFLLPEGGVSLLDVEGEVFHDPAADEALFEAIESGVSQTTNRVVRRVPFAINDTGFLEAVRDAFGEIMEA
ncbi:MAG: Tm-1-like ATP-binding domain-containing protein [Gemmatimonadetes bacterium]|nr:Tm-1-like ATP-binding domain-containing protein [Gemmatimonadota bacterium]